MFTLTPCHLPVRAFEPREGVQFSIGGMGEDVSETLRGHFIKENLLLNYVVPGLNRYADVLKWLAQPLF